MKTIKYISFILFPFLAVSQNVADKYVIDEDGIAGEKLDPSKTYDQNVNSNNIIYTQGKKFMFSYYYQNAKGERFLIKKGKDILQLEGYTVADWEFVDSLTQDKETIHTISLQVNLGNPFTNIPEYNQTSISYEYLLKNGEVFTMETTGAIENEMNVWIHPPRSSFFEILELNPFPYIKAPYKIGTKWNWKLQIGDHWSDKRWLEWKGEIENLYTYEIVDKKMITTRFGNLECFVIDAKANSRIGETKLRSYFNPLFGFIKLEYQNIDGSTTILELEKVE
ncbi:MULTISPECIES: hypothetical protein [Chryseobacterium]|uniref:DUF3108 domain-containing protein n=1 Tax=Chryseobacterium piscium TaxID=333702 RepID=A0A3D9BBP2_9FLAO|nr:MULTISPECIES: hypothetical protein [Chryseobacterium]REC42785.1 hypothetical protein DRF69_10395 [Chryseobacterium sp. 5_R23647]REC51024.1 hypothetical protein DRF62_17965 [Chryseobacterium piscium]